MRTSKLVTGLVRTRDEADAAIRRILQHGYHAEDISLLIGGEARWQRLALESTTRVVAVAGTLTMGEALCAVVTAIARTGKSVLVRSAGLFVGGPMADTLLDTGCEDGPLVVALVAAGIAEPRSRLYEPSLREGDIGLGLRVRSERDAAQIESILDDFTPEHMRSANLPRRMLDSFV